MEKLNKSWTWKNTYLIKASEYVYRVSEEVAQPNLKMDKRLKVFPKEDAQRTF